MFLSSVLTPSRTLSSLDLYPMNFSILRILARRVGGKTQINLDNLKPKLKATWANLDEKTMRAVCAKVPHRLEAALKAYEGHFV